MKKIALVICSIMLIYLNIIPVQGANYKKNETVYAQLNLNGEVQDIQVVHHLIAANKETTFIDSYSKDIAVNNLTDTSQPIINDKSIEWNINTPTTDFYYESNTKENLPYNFTIRYKVNDKEVSGEEVFGKSGKVEIIINASPNTDSNIVYRDNMMAQISLNLNNNYVSDISAPKATRVLAGKLTTLSYVVFPNQKEEFNISLEANNFEMDGMTISIIPNGFSLPKDMENQLDEMTDGFSQLNNAMGDIVNGTVKLQNGIGELSSGIDSINNNYKSFLGGTKDLTNNISSLLNGVVAFGSGINEISGGSQEINDAFVQLSSEGNTLSTGIKGLSEGYQTIASDDIVLLAQNLVSSSDPQVQALAQSVLGVNELNKQLDSLASGTDTYFKGVESFSQKYSSFNNGLEELSQGAAPLTSGSQQIIDNLGSYTEGAEKLGNGINQLDNEVKNLPSQVQLLVNGQKEFKNGIETATNSISNGLMEYTNKDIPAFPSFVYGDTQKLNSLQFIIKTPNIRHTEEDAISEIPTERKSFWEKLIDLFT